MENPAKLNSSLDQVKTLSFTPSQLNLINLLLPPHYSAALIEQNPRPRKKDSEKPTQANLPIKRLTRDKEPDLLKGKSEAFKKSFKALSKIKKSFLSKRFFAPSESLASAETGDEHIDLKSIENRLISGEYLSAYHLSKDIRKMISNHFLINARVAEHYLEVHEFSILFENLFKGCESLVFSESIVQDLSKKVERLSAGIKEIQNQIVTPKISKDKKMTQIEKKQLCSSLKKLDPRYLAGVLKIVKGSITNTGEELEFDLEKLPNKVCRELDRYIKQCLQFKQTKKSGGKDVSKSPGNVQAVKKDHDEKSESEESSSSSSQSEDELPGAPFDVDLWDREMDFMNEKY